jgi:hypothetical protein
MRLNVLYVIWALLTATVVVAFYYLLYVSNKDITAPAASYLSPNIFVMALTLFLGPYCYYNEKTGLEKFLLATRSDGGVAAKNVIKSGESVADMNLTDSTGGRTAVNSKSNGIVLNFTRGSDNSNSNSNSNNNKRHHADDHEGDDIIEEQFGSMMRSLSPLDVEMVAANVRQHQYNLEQEVHFNNRNDKQK